MFSYYGSKKRVAHLYPKPKFDKVIEPFAGSAQYSLRYFDRDVLLVDKYEVIVKIWKWLQQCSPSDILKLPRLKEGEQVSSFTFDCEEAALLMGFLAGKWVESPRNTATARATSMRPNNINNQLHFMAGSLFKIKHWKIELGDYRDIPNQEATWFIDPPYQVGGSSYRHHDIDYLSLAEWCKSRDGHVVVCENTGADWMEFLPMRRIQGNVRQTTEAIWSNCPHNFQAQQASMFEVTP